MRKYLSLLSLVFAFVLVSCSGKSGSDKQNKMQNDSEAMHADQSDQMSSGEQMSESGQTVHIFGIDQQKYVVAEKSDNLQTGKSVTIKGDTYYMLKGITAKAGSNLSVKLSNISELPAAAMSHNWCLLKMDTDAKAFANAGASAKDNDYIPQKMEDQVVKETGMVAGGKSKSVSFTVPEKTGQYEYICTFPGHFASGMKGTLTVN